MHIKIWMHLPQV
uniref:Jouberin isoform x1 n=1 Tax=Triatoma infestans TaxID=30076 RepID=A0A161MI84_TRIIF